MDFAVPADYRVKLKECERGISTSTLLRNKNLWNMKVMIIPIVIGAVGIVTKGLVQGVEDLEITGRVETVQTTALLRSARTLRIVLKTWGDYLSLKLQWKAISVSWCEKLSRSKIITGRTYRLLAFTWFQVFLFNTHNFQTYFFDPQNRITTGITCPGESSHGSNSNKEVLYPHQSSS